jgi:2-iminobutanoate/2-iminopropanoate deaminase
LIDYISAGAVSQLPFSSAVAVGDLVFVSGQASVDAETGCIVAGSFKEEMRRSFDNLERVLAAAGCSLQSIVSVRCYVDKQERLAEFNDVYRRIIPPPYPARTTLIGVLGNDFLKCEVDAIAHRTSGR